MATATIIGIALILAILAPLIVGHKANAQDVLNRLQPPSSAHLLGTDDLGRDVLSRLLVATRTDLVIGLLGAALPCLLGCALGACAGYLGRLVDLAVMRACDLVMAFPVYVLIITLVASLGAGAGSILIAFTLVGWVPYARLARDSVARTRAEDYVDAAYLGGLSGRQILVGHVFPNVRPALLAYMVVDVMVVILTVAAFSYLGLGIQSPTPEWGAMIADAQTYLQTNWWMTAAPGAMIAFVGIGFVLLGELVEARWSH